MARVASLEIASGRWSMGIVGKDESITEIRGLDGRNTRCCEGMVHLV